MGSITDKRQTPSHSDSRPRPLACLDQVQFNDKPVLLRTLVKTKEASNGAEEEGLHVAEPFVEFAIRKA